MLKDSIQWFIWGYSKIRLFASALGHCPSARPLSPSVNIMFYIECFFPHFFLFCWFSRYCGCFFSFFALYSFSLFIFTAANYESEYHFHFFWFFLCSSFITFLFVSLNFMTIFPASCTSLSYNTSLFYSFPSFLPFRILLSTLFPNLVSPTHSFLFLSSFSSSCFYSLFSPFLFPTS